MKTGAEHYKALYNRYYKTRKPGDDSMTDEAFNREAEVLMQKQEAAKPAEVPQENQQQTQQFAKGGKLPMYIGPNSTNGYNNTLPNTGFDPYNQNAFDYNQNQSFGNQYSFGQVSPLDYNKPNLNQNSQPFVRSYNGVGGNMESIGLSNQINGPTGLKLTPEQTMSQNYKSAGLGDLNFNKDREPSLINGNAQSNSTEFTGEVKDYSPAASILGPALSIGANAISTSILKNNAEKRKKDLLNNIGVNLGRVNANQIDLGRERANIRSNEALTESTGRYAAKGAKSASEGARIALMARLGGQRISGQQLGQSYQKEELTNADLRTRAADTNRQLSAQEEMMKQQQRMQIEGQYGDLPAQLNAQFAQTSGQSISNYLSENQRMKRDYDYMQMASPDLEMDYQTEFNKLTPTQQRLRRLGIGNVGKNIKARNYV